MIHLKRTVVHYPYLYSSSVHKPFFNHRPSNMLLRLFWFLICVYFKKVFVKIFMQNLPFFNLDFENSFQDVVYYRILGYQTIRISILKWRPFECKVKCEKKPLYFRSKIGIFDMFLKRVYKESFQDFQINSRCHYVP